MCVFPRFQRKNKDKFFTVNPGFGVYNSNMTYNRTIFTIWLGVAVLTLGVMTGCKKQPQPAPANDSNQTAQQQTAEPNTTVKPVVTAPPKLTINDIIKHARGWGPAFPNWYGKEAPDFTVTDLNGKKHTLSEYRGKNVMLNFWATWCPPCIAEIPHLIELRKQIGEDKLVILAISHIDPRNSTEAVRKFVTANPIINYPVTSTDAATMPRPYNYINSIPSSFFIAPDGKIKLVTEGMTSLPQMKAIIEAEQ